ncbi:branched-chain amino acid ABC transporter ATP-binding protein [Lacticaseibacillus chiayiensis]|uniref:branched-chain amino acid ABC transporter ATP-binding protein n=1 Tax=Lacticaseibacillus chiayiensis TaxID=2100821 RepID=UPI001BCB73C0|nr:branched-chain amino acid ABC transporter ATP-binding protein [Lacticaseibacillus chiayiensis]QVI35617.1 branched-chain amino acid ABC transporter ATP-binding protein [Lacticaseibacillus chiayiensis]
MLFRSKQLDVYRENLAKLFAPKTIQYLYVPDEASLNDLRDQYIKNFASGGLLKQLAFISSRDTGILDYLSVRNNLYINGHSKNTDFLPEWLNNNSPILDQPAATLDTMQRLYLQFYRGLMGKKRYLLLSGRAEVFDPQVTRAFLTEAHRALQQTDSCLLVLTTDQSLLSANPQNAWKQPPVLSLNTLVK